MIESKESHDALYRYCIEYFLNDLFSLNKIKSVFWSNKTQAKDHITNQLSRITTNTTANIYYYKTSTITKHLLTAFLIASLCSHHSQQHLLFLLSEKKI